MASSVDFVNAIWKIRRGKHFCSIDGWMKPKISGIGDSL